MLDQLFEVIGNVYSVEMPTRSKVIQIMRGKMNLSPILTMLGVWVVTLVEGTFAVQQTKGLGVKAQSSNQDKISAEGFDSVLSNNMLPGVDSDGHILDSRMITVSTSGDVETRPRNFAVAYIIKIR